MINKILDDFVYETMFILFSLVGFLYFFFKKINYLKKYFKKVFYYIIFLVVNSNVTALYFSFLIFSKLFTLIEYGIQIRREILEEMKFKDDFTEGEEYVPVYCLQRVVSC